MTGIQRYLFIVLITLSCVGCDQASKAVAREYLPRSERVSLLGDVLRLQYAENSGAFLGLGSALPEKSRTVVFTGVVAVMVIGLLVYLFFASTLPPLMLLGLTLLGSGGLSNLLDRIFYQGRVIDFLNLGVGEFRTGVFNIADVGIMLGAIIIIVVQQRRVSPSDQ